MITERARRLLAAAGPPDDPCPDEDDRVIDCPCNICRNRRVAMVALVAALREDTP